MSNLQYELKVQNNSIQSEEGSFFYAAPFDVHIGDKHFHVTFEKGSEGTVARRVSLNGDVILELKHPDYTPECTVDKVNDELNLAEAQSLFAAFGHCKVIFEKEYLKHFESDEFQALDYRLTQASFL